MNYPRVFQIAVALAFVLGFGLREAIHRFTRKPSQPSLCIEFLPDGRIAAIRNTTHYWVGEMKLTIPGGIGFWISTNPPPEERER